MNATSYPHDRTGLLLVDPYNDFLSEGGKLNGPAKPVLDAVETLKHLREVVAATRAAGIQIFYVPHRRALPEDFKGWKHPSPISWGALGCRLLQSVVGAANGIRTSSRKPAT